MWTIPSSPLAIIGGVGVPELILILVIVLIVFGAGKLPQIGDALGKGIRNFKKATGGEDVEDVTPKDKAKPELNSGRAKGDEVEIEDVTSSKRSS
jgi:sec-independent protein translocase protein TatA